MNNNVILIGMPGAGKSTVGVILAKTLGMQFLDTDLLISAQQNARLQELLDARGLEGFLACEQQAGLSVDVSKTVIATGGSMVLCAQAMAHLKTLGTVVYLETPLETLAARLNNITTRGIAARPGETLEEIDRVRKPYYERYADMTVRAQEGMGTEDVVSRVISRLTGENHGIIM